MERRIGTVSRGLRAPIIKEGDDLQKIVCDTFMNCIENGEFEIGSKDVLAVTESILARSQANYATKDQLAKDVKNKLGGNNQSHLLQDRGRRDTCPRQESLRCR